MNRTPARVTTRAGGRPALVSRPDGSSLGRLSVDMLSTLTQARADHLAACFIRPRVLANESLFALTADDVPVIHCDGVAWAGLRARWGMSAFVERCADAWRDGQGALWREFGREIRVHAGDERVPGAVRARLRDVAHRSLSRSADGGEPVRRYPRRLLRARVSTSLPPALLATGEAAATALGIAVNSPIVALDAAIRSEASSDARSFLEHHGYTVVAVGDGSSPVLDVFILLVSRFVMCASVDLQQAAYLTNTPSLTLNAADPFVGYPVRDDGLYTIRKVIDLDSGRVLTASDLLSESYFRNVRNCGYRDNTSAEVLEAVREMHEGVSQGWQQSESQARFRQRVIEAGSELAPRVRYVAEWGPDRGFIGDGRLARFQADEVT